ncbi:phosphoribosylaminoimidazolesuccinocarboxamide synthase [bacterium]|nr:MAG: phosphoribosylaminoimidazolesuccinocarboxamide synthase [bacterium]
MNAVVYTKIDGREPDFRGKVRDIYDLGDKLLIVATDRVSAFDHILKTPIPERGKILTRISVFWFGKTQHIINNHLITANIREFPKPFNQYPEILEDRSMLVRKAKRVDVECVVRGYLAGSAWKEYSEKGEICGIKLPEGLSESDKLPEPIFTPATKAPEGTHDINISYEELVNLVGKDLADQLRNISIKLYNFAHDFLLKRGVIIADTKFEFGILDGELILIDEIFTPDSSRFWDLNSYKPGIHQEPMDKQLIRDYLLSIGWHGEGEPPYLPEDIVQKTIQKYKTIEKLVLGDR